MLRDRSSHIPRNLIFLALLLFSHIFTKSLPAAPITSLQNAYNQANNGEVIRVHTATFAEELILNRSVAVTIDGGYTDSRYTVKLGVTTLLGTLTIADGTLTASDLAIGSAESSAAPPTISGISAAAPDIAWSTDQHTTSRIEYGETTSYGSSVSSSIVTTSHTLTLTGLSANTTYHYRIISANGAGQSTTTADATFVTPSFVVAPVSETGGVVVMQASGSFDAKNADGSSNSAPRQEVAKRFIADHGDSYDFLVILTTFPVAMPSSSAKGFYTGVKNDTQGTGQSLFDNGSAFGSSGKLQGVIDMGDISDLVADPSAATLDEKLTILAHEVAHRFSAYSHISKVGMASNALLGEDHSHWSYLLDSQASVMYGNAWQNNGDGTFTATGIGSGYSQLDLYLMGMLPKEQVPPMLLIANPSIDAATTPVAGATISGIATTVTIDEIVAAVGERIPVSTQAQKAFKIGYILLTRPGTEPGSAPATVATLGNAFAGGFAQLTGGVGMILDVARSLTLAMTDPASGTSITGPDTTIAGLLINSTGAETGVTVNGIPATVNGSRFIVSHVPLQEGSNSVVISATDVNGQTTATTTTLTGVAGNYIRLHSNVESGLAPLDLTLIIDGSFSIPSSQLFFSGPADIQLIGTATPDEYPLRLPVEGEYALTVQVTGPGGQTYEDSLEIMVLPRLGLDRLLKQKWEGMKAALSNSNVSGAIANMSEPAQTKYQPVFQELLTNLPGIAAGMRSIDLDYLQQDVAQYRISRTETISGQPREISYFIYFSKDGNGIWKLDQF